MEKINVMDFEKEVIKKYLSEEEFLDFLNKNSKKELVMNYSKLELKELEDEDIEALGEESVLDYLEEIASITPKSDLEGEDFILLYCSLY